MIKRLTIIIAGFSLAYITSIGLSLYQLRTALFEEDAVQLTQSIDFDSVRESLRGQIDDLVKQKMGESKGGNMLAALGMAIAGPMVEQMLEGYVTPEGIFELIRTGKPKLGKPKSTRSSGAGSVVASQTSEAQAPNTFLRSIKGAQWMAADRFKLLFYNKKNDRTAELEFKFDNFRWRLVAIQLPALAAL